MTIGAGHRMRRLASPRHATAAVLFTAPAVLLAGPALAAPLLSLCLATFPPVRPDELWASWSLAPETLLPILLAALLYVVGTIRRTTLGDRPSRREAVLYAAGILFLAVALVSPLCRLAAGLASAHMVQHLILVAVAPPLLALARPGRTLGAAMPRRWRSSVPRFLPAARPGLLPAAAVYGALIWFWHVPALYQASLTSSFLHLAMVATLLASSLLFWSEVVAGLRSPRTRGGAVLIVLLGTLIHLGLLGALLSLSPTAWYAVMAEGALAWRTSPLADQQLAGLIMWVPASAIYLAAVLGILFRLLSGPGRPEETEARG